jgi:pimeloyl-ACP methyl ester carboxylesterase
MEQRESAMFEATAVDGTPVEAFDEGSGPVILILHPGLDDGASWAKVATALADRYRVLRLRRRQYRLDLPHPPAATIADEVRDVAAIADSIGTPIVIVGHSSGGVVALEALAALPRVFAGGVIYEAPVVTDLPLGSPEASAAMSAARDAGRPGVAIQVFTRDVVKVPPSSALAIRMLIGFMRKLRALVPRQVDDAEAIVELGDRRGLYATIEPPVLLLGGDSSPAHLGLRLDALEAVIPRTERVTMARQGHAANQTAPAEVARIIDEFARRALG